jgi:3-methyladenine DNA glycosylase AlkD
MKRRAIIEVQSRCAGIAPVVPLHRSAFKRGYSFSHLPPDEQFILWDHVWMKADNFWPMAHAYFYCETILKNERQIIALWPSLMKWQDRSDRWELNDCLSKVYSRILEVDPAMVFPVLEKWNLSSDPWKRRQSLVSLFYYSRVRKKVLLFRKYIEMVENLLKDDHYYVQKGLGWTLRESGNVYPEETFSFMLRNIADVSPIAFTAAIEKMDPRQKEKLKNLRKKKP